MSREGKIGQLVVERDFLADASQQLLGMRPSRDLAFGRALPVNGTKMVSRDHKLSMRKQCELLQLSRSRLYCRLVGESTQNLRFMEIIHCPAGLCAA